MERHADRPGPPGGPEDPARPAGAEGRFGRTHRLSRTWQYQRAYAAGRSVRGRLVVLYAHVVAGEPSRVGIVASRKLGGAVVRNRTKRRLREIVRNLWPDVKDDGRQLVVIALPPAAGAAFAELAADVTDLMRRMEALRS